jgi:hypothetical protein
MIKPRLVTAAPELLGDQRESPNMSGPFYKAEFLCSREEACRNDVRHPVWIPLQQIYGAAATLHCIRYKIHREEIYNESILFKCC